VIHIRMGCKPHPTKRYKYIPYINALRTLLL